MGLFWNKDKYQKLLDEALVDYQKQNYTSCYQKVCEAADNNSPRGLFCKALLLYNDNINPDVPVDSDILLETLRAAVELKYELAYGAYASLLEQLRYNDLLCEFCSQTNKVKDGGFLAFQSAYEFGLFSEDEDSDNQKAMQLALQAAELLGGSMDALGKGKDTSLVEYSAYNPYYKMSLPNLYAKANFLLMLGYYLEDNWENRRAFMSAFSEVSTHMTNLNEKFRASKIYMLSVLNNYLGMRDLKEAHTTMKRINEIFEDMSEEEKEAYSEDYDRLYNDYQAFVSEENERLGEREITYSDGYANQNDLSARNIVSSIASGVQSWANSPSSGQKSHAYIVNGREYMRGDMGYLYDQDGIRTGYQVDDYNRLHDENGNELGYFNLNGNFISS